MYPEYGDGNPEVDIEFVHGIINSIAYGVKYLLILVINREVAH